MGWTAAAVVMSTPSAFGQNVPPAVRWRIDAPDYWTVTTGPDGNPVAIGWDNATMVASIAKLDRMTGTVIWENIGGWDSAAGVACGADGNPMVVAGAASGAGPSDIFVVKLDGSTGAVLWNSTFNSAQTESPVGIAAGTDGNPVAIFLHYQENFAGYDIRVIKYDGATGTILWNIIYAQGRSYPVSVAVGPDGNPVIVGQSYDPGAGLTSSLVVKLGGVDGSVLWTKVGLESLPIYGSGVAVGSDGNPIVTGQAGQNLATVKLNGATGDLLWSQSWPDGHVPGAVVIKANGNPITAGTRTLEYDGTTGRILWVLPADENSLSGAYGLALNSNGDMFAAGEALIAYRSNPELLWIQSWANLGLSGISLPLPGPLGQVSGPSLVFGTNGNPLVLSPAPGSIGPAFQVAQLQSATGTAAWNPVFDPGSNFSPARSAIGAGGNVVLIGANASTSFQIADQVLSYDAFSGAILWQTTVPFANPDGGTNVTQLVAVAVGPDGNPVVAGSSIAKLDRATGQTLWAIADTLLPSTNLVSQTVMIAVGSDNNPLVLDGSLRKFDGATGSVLWSLDPPGSPFPPMHALAVGPDGNPVVVSSRIFAPAAISQTEFVKVNGADGTILWAASVTNTATLEELGGVAVGQDGIPVVTLISRPLSADIFSSTQLRVLRLSPATGSILSRQNLDTPGDEQAASVGVGPDGNPVVAVGALNWWSYDPNPFELWVFKPLAPSPTAPGLNIEVPVNGGTTATNGVSLTFSQVDTAGTTTVYTSDSGNPLPSGFSLGTPAVYYDISTTASYSSTVTICIHYDPAQFTDPANVHLLHYENNQWVDVTVTNDVGNQLLYGSVTSLSPFVIAQGGHLQFSGFLAPIGGADATGGSFSSPWRTFKLKSTIPIKFRISQGSTPVITGNHTLEAIKWSSATNSDPPVDATPQDAATTGNHFRLAGGEWHFNLDTKTTAMSAGIWELVATLSDGSAHAVWIQLK